MSSTNGTISAFIGSKWATVAVVVALATGAIAVPVVTGGSGGGGTCDRSATTGTFATQVSAASAGETICLASGLYTWSGASKSDPGITITAANGASVTMDLSFTLSAVQNITIDGDVMGGDMTIDGAQFTGSTTTARNITVRDADVIASIVIDGPTGSNITLGPGLTINDLDINGSCSDSPARIWLSYYSATHSGVTITGNTMIGGSKDGVQGAVGVTITDNHFEDIDDTGHPCAHTDSIQGVGANGMIITGNTLINNASGIVDFDNTAGNTITDNACRDIHRLGGACITLYSDNGSVVEHNTNTGDDPVLELDKKGPHDTGTGTVYRNNAGGLINNGQGVASNTNNLFSGASSPNISGTATFAGGGTLDTWEDWCLTGPSGGMTGSTTGGPVGIRC